MTKRFTILLGLLLGLLFVGGVLGLFMLRIQSGDIYPAYSSLRSDPLGTRVVYEALADCPHLTVSRGYRPFDQMTLSPDTTLIYFGDVIREHEQIDRETRIAFDTFLTKGGRCVVTLFPRHIKPDEPDEDDSEDDDKKKDEKKETAKPSPDKSEKSEKSDKSDEPDTHEPITAWLGVELVDVPFTAPAWATQSVTSAGGPLPASLSCHTSIAFTNLNDAWQVLYERDGHPVVIEKQVGRGAFVLSALSYIVSNEAMRRERHPALLAWLVGPHRRLIIDETHHGVLERDNLAALLRRYNLYWVIGLFMLLAVLFLWQNITSLVPPFQPGELSAAKGASQGLDSAAGLTNLLRANIPARRLLPLCVEEWKKVTAGTPERAARAKQTHARIDQRIAESVQASTTATRLVQTYNDISRIINERRPHASHATKGDAEQRSE